MSGITDSYQQAAAHANHTEDQLRRHLADDPHALRLLNRHVAAVNEERACLTEIIAEQRW